MRTVADDLAAHAARHPARIALDTPTGQVTYGRLAARTGELTRLLRAHHAPSASRRTGRGRDGRVRLRAGLHLLLVGARALPPAGACPSRAVVSGRAGRTRRPPYRRGTPARL